MIDASMSVDMCTSRCFNHLELLVKRKSHVHALSILVVHTNCAEHILMLLTGKIAILLIFSAKS